MPPEVVTLVRERMSRNGKMKRTAAEKDDDYDEGGRESKRRSMSVTSPYAKNSRKPKRESAVRCTEMLQRYSTEALAFATSAKKEFPSAKHVPGVNAAMKGTHMAIRGHSRCTG